MTATLHEGMDVCALRSVVVVAAPITNIESSDRCAINITPIFIHQVQMASTESADVGAINAPSSITYMPPATSLTNAEGVWTISGGSLLLNGVATNIPPTLVELVGGTIFARDTGGNWWQRYNNSFLPSTGGTYMGTQDPGALIIAPIAPYVGPTNTPDIWSLELTDYASLTAQAGYSLDGSNHSVPWCFTQNGPCFGPLHVPPPASETPEFGVDSLGISYLRFSNNPNALNTTDGSGSDLIAWFMPLGGTPNGVVGTERLSVNVRYLLWIEDDVAPAFNEAGMKLPGAGSDTGFGNPGGLVSWRLWHTIPGNNTYDLRNYRFDATDQSQGQDDFYVRMHTNRWNCLELRMVLNTIGVSDGYAAVWLDGNKVYENSALLLRTDPQTMLRSFFVDVYHGGIVAPKGIMHYRLAKLAVSSTYIGVPSELISGPSPTFPAWRRNMPTPDTLYTIHNTANMAGDMQDEGGSITPPFAGKSFLDIDTWSGFAWDTHSWWGVAMGGHNGQWSNKVFRVDFSQDQPLFLLEYLGSNTATPYDYINGTYPIPSQSAMYNGKLDYYQDGKPCARHTYFASQYIAARHRVFLPCDPAAFGNPSYVSSACDAYDVVAKAYDPSGTWPRSDIYTGYRPFAPAVAKHPVTEDIYMNNNGVTVRFNQAAGTFTTFSIAQGYPFWTYNGSIIDVARNRWVFINGTNMEWVDISNPNAPTFNPGLPVTGNSNFTVWASTIYNTLVHDLDNDRYVYFTGDTVGINNNAQPGKAWYIDPVTAAIIKVVDIPAPFNGWNNRATFFSSVGGIALLPAYDSDILFLPTR